MQFKNIKKEAVMVFTDEGDNVWKNIKSNQTVDIPQEYGRRLGFEAVALKSKVAKKVVETKQAVKRTVKSKKK